MIYNTKLFNNKIKRHKLILILKYMNWQYLIIVFVDNIKYI